MLPVASGFSGTVSQALRGYGNHAEAAAGAGREQGKGAAGHGTGEEAGGQGRGEGNARPEQARISAASQGRNDSKRGRGKDSPPAAAIGGEGAPEKCTDPALPANSTFAGAAKNTPPSAPRVLEQPRHFHPGRRCLRPLR